MSVATRGKPRAAPPPVVTATPAPPSARAQPAPAVPQFYRPRPVVKCPHCGSARVRRNGGSPVAVAYFTCGACVDDNPDSTDYLQARTFKLPVADV